jgi:hypothetical protein
VTTGSDSMEILGDFAKYSLGMIETDAQGEGFEGRMWG